MKTTYSVGELSSLLGISAQTIRKYEKLGLINTVRQDNNYRCFEAPDITLLMRIRMYRNLGFSIKEIQSLLQKEVHESSRLYDKRIDMLAKEIERLQMLVKCAERHKNYLSSTEKEIGEIVVAERPAMVGVIYRKKRSIIPYFLKNGMLNHLLDYVPPFQYMINLDKDCFDQDTNQYSVGFAVPKEFAHMAPQNEYMFEIPSRVCVGILIKHDVRRINDQWENISMRDEFRRYGVHAFMEEKNLSLCDDIVGYTYNDTVESPLFVHYIKYWLPIF